MADLPASNNDLNDLLGVPFKWHGRNAHEGFDCYGLVIEWYKRRGIKIEDPIEYAASPYNETKDIFVEHSEPNWKEATPPYEIGDVFLFGYKGHATHCALLVAINKLIHTGEHIGTSYVPVKKLLPNLIKVYRRKCQP